MLNKGSSSFSRKNYDVRNSQFQQRYHFMAPAYWINDPNGLIQFNGRYHLFYQQHPYSAQGEEMHWGHAISKDMITWENTPIVLASSKTYSTYKHGDCFSGCAIDNNGVLSLLYTGEPRNEIEPVQQHCIAYSTDGINFMEYNANPLSIPPSSGLKGFKNLKVWKHDNKWYMVTDSCKENSGKAFLFQSIDLKDWKYIGVMAENNDEPGTTWECPDFFEIPGKDVLLFSPTNFADRHAVYLTGTLDYNTGKFLRSTMGEVDRGFDFYAPQSFSDNQGRRIIIGWTNAWNWIPSWWQDFGPTYQEKWFGAMSLPRTVQPCKDGKLQFAPVEELKNLRGKHYCISNLSLTENSRLQLIAGDGISYEIEADFDLTKADADEIGFALRCSEYEQTLVIFDLKNSRLIFNRTNSDSYGDGIRTCFLESASQNTLKLQIFVDTCSVEIFTDNGRTVMSSNIFPLPDSTGLYCFTRHGTAKITKIDTWGLSAP